MEDTDKTHYINFLLDKLLLTEYTDSYTTNLSGGNKRKLCVALSILMGNEIIFLDEPSSGMDPRARRELWKLISDQTTVKNNSIILTTHSMEEAERVCGRIGIMVKGQLKCLGTTQHLKLRFGNIYRLLLTTNQNFDQNSILEFLSSHFKNSELLESYGHSLVYSISIDDSLARAYNLLEEHKNDLNISSFRIAQSSVEQLFMYLIRQQIE